MKLAQHVGSMGSIAKALDRTLNSLGDGPMGFVLLVFPSEREDSPCTVLSNLEDGPIAVIAILDQVNAQLREGIPVAGHA